MTMNGVFRDGALVQYYPFPLRTLCVELIDNPIGGEQTAGSLLHKYTPVSVVKYRYDDSIQLPVFLSPLPLCHAGPLGSSVCGFAG